MVGMCQRHMPPVYASKRRLLLSLPTQFSDNQVPFASSRPATDQ